MKWIAFILSVIIFSCSNPSTEEEEFELNRPDQNICDTIFTYLELEDTISFSKGEIERFNRFFDMDAEVIDPPDEMINRIMDDDSMELRYGSEVGTDHFHLIYAYTLRNNKKLEYYELLKNHLVRVYRSINAIHSALDYGGTYYGHQYWRAPGVAEYWMYQKKIKKVPTFDFFLAEHKKPFIDSIESHIHKHIMQNSDLYTEEMKLKRIHEIQPLVEHLDSLIDSYFYLDRARQYREKYYCK